MSVCAKVVRALVCFSISSSLMSPQPQEAPDDSHSLSAGMELEERGFGTVSLKWCEQSKRAGETFEYFDSCSWHSDILSDFSGEGEDSVDALRRLEDAYIFRQTMGVSVCSGHTKARRRESVSAKDSHRDVTDTYVKPSTYSLKKGPENCVAPNLPLKLSKKDLFSFEIQPHLNTEKVKEQCTLQTVVTEPCSPHIQKQHKTETFDPKVNTSHTQVVKLLVQPENNSGNRLNRDYETQDSTVETQQQHYAHKNKTHSQKQISLAGPTSSF